MGNFGIDKIHLHTKDFAVRDASRQLFGYNVSTPQGGGEVPVLMRDGTGREVVANKIHRNTNLVNYTIGTKGLLVGFNPSKRFHPYHLTGAGDGLAEVVQGVEKDMKAAGIIANLSDMKLVRFDLTAQHQMMQPCYQYNQVFRLLKGKRCKNQREYPTGYQFGNTQWQTIGYDKIQALQDAGLGNLVGTEKNLLRIENKLLKSQAITRTMPFATLGGLLKVDNFTLEDLYRDHLQKKVFNRHLVAEQLFLDLDNEFLLMQEIVSLSSSAEKAAMNHLHSIGGYSYNEALLKFGGIDGYRKFLEGFYSRKTTYRVINALQKNIALQARIDANRGNITAGSLLAEVQAKFAA